MIDRENRPTHLAFLEVFEREDLPEIQFDSKWDREYTRYLHPGYYLSIIDDLLLEEGRRAKAIEPNGDRRFILLGTDYGTIVVCVKFDRHFESLDRTSLEEKFKVRKLKQIIGTANDDAFNPQLYIAKDGICKHTGLQY
ncbi:MAG TPA: hypothetical protein VN843_07235 [Anaerolineales bacterium]|nr:hypothetical protein [Anaerolineales bacterium]